MTFWKNVVLVLAMGAILLLGASAIVAGPFKQQDVKKDFSIENPALKEFSTLESKMFYGQGLSDYEKLRYLELKEIYGQRPNRENSLDNQGGPDAFQYIFMDNVAPDTVTYDWIELRGDPTATWINNFSSHDDGMSPAIPIGFSFPFYGVNHDSMRVCTNGNIQFNTANTSGYDDCLPSPNLGAALCPYLTDLHLNRGGNATGTDVVAYKNFGTYTVIEFDSVGFYTTACAPATLKFEVIIYDNGRIKFQYNNMVVTTCGSQEKIGIQQSGTGTQLQYVCNADGFQPDNGRAILFTRPDGIPQAPTSLAGNAAGNTVTLTWVDPTHDTNGNPITLTNVEVWLGTPGVGTLLGTVLPGVQTYIQTDAPNGSQIYYVRAFRTPYYGQSAHVTVLIGDISYAENFDVTNGGWVAEPANGWMWGAPTNAAGPQPNSPPNVWGSGLNANYANSACYNLTLSLGLPVVSDTAVIHFYGWYITEQSFDGCHFKVSVDGGTTWELVTPEGGYPQASVFSNLCIGATTPCWAGNSNGWQYFTLPIGQYMGSVPMFRFVFGSDGSVTFPGFFIDDMVIYGLGSAAGIPLPVTNLTASTAGNNVTLNWTDPNHDMAGNAITPDGIEIYLGTPATGTLLATVPAGTQTYTQVNAPSGHNTYSVRAVLTTHFSTVNAVTITVGTPTYFEDFESTNGGWVADPETGGWEWGTPTPEGGPDAAYSGVNCWGTLLNGEYPTNACFMLDLELGMVVNSPGASVEFWMWREIEQGWDGCNLKVSIDDGATWEIVTPTDGYPTAAISTADACLAGQPGWSGVETTWQFVTIPVGQYVGQSPRFKFTFGSDGSVVNRGMFIDDLAIWGLAIPPLASVSGTLHLNGGSGNITQAVVRSNGYANPFVNPAANGTFTLPTVQVGSRILNVSLNGYIPLSLPIMVPDTGIINLDLTISRTPPPVPTTFTSVLDTLTGIVTLNWDDSPDADVDRYYVYRRISEDPAWTLIRSVTVSQATDQIPVIGLWEYSVTAVDSVGPITPVESEHTAALVVLWGQAPPHHLRADGTFDDRVRLNWLSPGESPEFEIFYDNVDIDPTCVTDGLGFNGLQPFGWFVAHYQGNGPITINRVKTGHWPESTPGCTVQMGVFEDDGTGLPTFEPLSATDWTIEDPTAWQDVELTEPVTVNSGSFFVGIRQVTAQRVDIGMDECAAEQPNTFFVTTTNTTPWTDLGGAGFPQVLVIRAFVVGDMGQVMTLEPTPIQKHAEVAAKWQPSENTANLVSLSDILSTSHTIPLDKKSVVGPVDRTLAAKEAREASLKNIALVSPRKSFVPVLNIVPVLRDATSTSRNRNGGNLDEVLYYIVYKDGVDVAHPTATTYDDINGSAGENIVHNYYVSTFNTGNIESGVTLTVSRSFNMAPGAPTDLTGLTQNSTSIMISWTDPTVNADGTPCVDLQSLTIYRDDIQIGTVNAGVHQFLDVPPIPNHTYTWSVRAQDEIPNVGPAATWSGSVVDVWMEATNQWVDISTTGTNTDLGDDENAGPYPLGFTFNYFGNDYTSIRVCSNGWLSFTSTGTLRLPSQIPSVAEPNNALYVLWDDFDASTVGSIVYYADAANNQFIVSWLGVPLWQGTDPFTFQAIIKSNGEIIYNYQVVPDNSVCLVGVENATGTSGIQLCLGGQGSFLPVDGSAVSFYGPPPTYAQVTGHVTIDGGNQPVVNALVSCNGVSHPTAHPLANGDYTLNDVQVGARRLIATLDGYIPDTLLVTVPAGGSINANLLLRRENPPQLLNLTSTLNNSTGRDSLHWDISTDLLVDQYRVYRRLRGETAWVLNQTVNPRTHNYAIDMLTVSGIYQYAVTAVDVDVVAPPVESEYSDYAEALYGALPPQMLSANGNFDNKIRLSWLAPGVIAATEVYYDSADVDPTCVSDGLGFNGVQPFGWFVAHYQGNGAITINNVKTRHWPQSAPGCTVQMGVFEDDGTGLPTFEPLGVTDWTIEDPTAWQDVTLTTPVTVASGSFFVGIRQVTAQRVDIGMDECAAQQTSTFFVTTTNTTPWTDLGGAGFPQVLCIRAIVSGDMGAGLMTLSPTPVQRTSTSNPFMASTMKTGDVASITDALSSSKNIPADNAKMANMETKSGKFDKSTSGKMTKGAAPVASKSVNKSLRAITQRSARIENDKRDARDRNNLDEVTFYRIFRNGTFLAQVPATQTTYENTGLVENVQYSYYVTAMHDNGQESTPTNTVVAACNLSPNEPTDFTVTPFGGTQMRLTWVNPTTNPDGTPCVDLAGVKVYRDGVFIANATGTQFSDSPPVPNARYTWCVSSYDEVPNVSPQVCASGSVVSPWEVTDYDWVDISTVGTPTGLNGDDQNMGPFPLGFTMNYYGEDYNSIRVCSNGWASFTSSATVYIGTAIPNTAEPNAVIYANWDDLTLSSGQCLYYADAANQRFIISWINVPLLRNAQSLNTFQIILNQNGEVKIQYMIIPDVTSCTIGVENAGGTDAIQLLFDGAGDFTPTENSAVSFWGGPAGELNGLVVVHTTNAPLPGVKIFAEGAGDTVLTDANGNYVYRLEPGTYSVTYRKVGFCDSTITDVVIEDAGAATIDNRMKSPSFTGSVTSLSYETWPQHVIMVPITFTNPTGNCPLEYTITDTSAWLRPEPASGEVAPGGSAQINVWFDVQTLQPGSEHHSALFIHHNVSATVEIIPVDLQITVDVPPDPNAALPTEFAFYQNYPNPFNATTALKFDVPQESRVKITIFNVLGQDVAHPVDGLYTAGRHSINYTAADLPSGMYIVRMEAGSFTAMSKMMLLK